MDDRTQLERDYWDENALDPDVDIKYISDVSTEEMIEALGEIPERAICLDLGCGVGRISKELDEKYDHSVYGIDISEKMISLAQHRHGGGVYYVSDGRTIPENIVENNIGFAYSMLVFQHLKADVVQNYMKEIYRVLVPGGIFRFQFVEGTNSEGPFSNHYTYMQMSDWLREAGFVVDKVDRGLCHFQWVWVTARKAD